MAILNPRANFIEKARRFGMKVTDFVPATGIGKFDAQFDPAGKSLTIALKLYYTWVNVPGRTDWTGGEQDAFRIELKRQVEAFWSNRFAIAADKDDFRDLYATVRINVETVRSRAAAHYAVEVHNYPAGDPDALRAGIDRNIRKLAINQFDVEPQNNVRRDIAALRFRLIQVNDKIDSSNARYLAFPNNSSEMPADAAAALTRLCTSLRAILTPDAVEAGCQILVYGRTILSTGNNRSRAVAAFLESRLPRGCARVLESAPREPWFQQKTGEVLRKNGLAPNASSFPGVILLTPDINTNFERGLARNYVVAVHECGHMFGLPDEYQGVNCLGLQKQMDLSFYVPTVLKGKNPRAQNEGLQAQAEGMAKLLQATGVPSPIFAGSMDAVPTSIMYAGSTILPAHYLPFWEALLNITSPTFQPGEWKIVPNGANAGTPSTVELFAR